MATFKDYAITDSGRILKSHVDVGATFVPTRVVVGSGYIPAGKTARTMTAVVTPVKSLAVNKAERTPDGKVIFGGMYDNSDITEAFYFRELALYAKAVYPDGTEVDEALYCYGNGGDDAEYMAAYSTSTVVERQLDLVTYIGNDAVVNLTIASGVYASLDEFRSHAERHKKGGEDAITPADIGAAPAGFGLGANSAAVENNDANNAVVNGWYQCKTNTPTGDWCDVLVVSLGTSFSVTQFAFDRYQFLGGNAAYYWMRTKRNDHEFTPWEVVNPPMTEGEEYRTTERIDGKVVYKKNVNGVIQYRLEGETSWKIYANVVGAALADHTHTPDEVGASPLGHNHDERYYTEAEVNNLLAQKAPAYTYGTANIEAGTASSAATGTLHFIYE